MLNSNKQIKDNPVLKESRETGTLIKNNKTLWAIMEYKFILIKIKLLKIYKIHVW